jgi:hypothetical protein
MPPAGDLASLVQVLDGASAYIIVCTALINPPVQASRPSTPATD